MDLQRHLARPGVAPVGFFGLFGTRYGRPRSPNLDFIPGVGSSVFLGSFSSRSQCARPGKHGVVEASAGCTTLGTLTRTVENERNLSRNTLPRTTVASCASIGWFSSRDRRASLRASNDKREGRGSTTTANINSGVVGFGY
ncbi:hypothetical protein E1B28_006859 [Marasmius oreades]|uniref:Uncharacterized protein n=1 Tax=Marasmius oreades TaxID=181124 RepID=A0A9P7UTF6_9AGAR|nr:uncharacterized protein E1B28_006859 [Marasmius oreades]KAG7093170.1 hypothetical protein E1B28_006859 [Marasmius oreades]